MHLTPGVEARDLIVVRDRHGAMHLAHAYLKHAESDWRPEAIQPSPKDGFYIAYFSDHPGDFVYATDATSALELLRSGTWYLQPLRDALTSTVAFLTPAVGAVVGEVLRHLESEEFITGQSGTRCHRSGKWVLRGTNHACEIEAGATLPTYTFVPQEPQGWCHWDLPCR